MRRNLMSRIEKMANLETGRELYAVIVGNLPFRKKVVKRFANFIKRLDGAVAVTSCYPNGTIVYFDTLNDAKRGKNELKCVLHPVGDEIIKFVIAEDGVPEEDAEWGRKFNRGN